MLGKFITYILVFVIVMSSISVMKITPTHAMDLSRVNVFTIIADGCNEEYLKLKKYLTSWHCLLTTISATGSLTVAIENNSYHPVAQADILLEDFTNITAYDAIFLFSGAHITFLNNNLLVNNTIYQAFILEKLMIGMDRAPLLFKTAQMLVNKSVTCSDDIRSALEAAGAFYSLNNLVKNGTIITSHGLSSYKLAFFLAQFYSQSYATNINIMQSATNNYYLTVKTRNISDQAFGFGIKCINVTIIFIQSSSRQLIYNFTIIDDNQDGFFSSVAFAIPKTGDYCISLAIIDYGDNIENLVIYRFFENKNSLIPNFFVQDLLLSFIFLTVLKMMFKRKNVE